MDFAFFLRLGLGKVLGRHGVKMAWATDVPFFEVLLSQRVRPA